MKLKEWLAMDVIEFQKWVNDYYETRGWSELDIFIRIGFLAEETGEVARAIRALEIGRDRPDEINDFFVNNRKALEIGRASCRERVTSEVGEREARREG